MKNIVRENNLIEKIINFVKYHNAFTIGLMLVFVFTGAIFASEDLRDKVIGEEIISQAGVDNTALLSANLDNFDLAMTIDAVLEDNINYYIDYSFKTLGIKDNIWQEMIRSAQMVVSKKALAGEDLGLYLTEELGEITDHELNYLQQVQTAEKEKGETKIVKTTEYTGLVGLVLDAKEKIFSGYELVVKPVEPDPVKFIETITSDVIDDAVSDIEETEESEETEEIPDGSVTNEEVEEVNETEESGETDLPGPSAPGGGGSAPSIPSVETTTSSEDGIE